MWYNAGEIGSDRRRTGYGSQGRGQPGPAQCCRNEQAIVKTANAPDLSFRGAKRRGNLLQPVTFSPRPTCYPTWYCEIATSAVGLLAMTKLTASRHKINAANNWGPAWRSQPAIGFHVLSPPCTSRQCLPEIATSAVGLLAMTHQGGAVVHQRSPTVECPCTRRSLPARGTPHP